jgi:hypothetical protein
MPDVHVVPDGDDWALEVDGQKRDSFRTQNEALTRGRQLAQEEGSELVTHGEDGQIREKASHGNDPREIPG